MDTLFENVVLDSLKDVGGGTLTMGLSAGHDSRTILHYLRRSKINVCTFTFGQVGNADFDLVQALSDRLQLDHVMVDTSETEWRLEWFDEVTPCIQDLPVSPRVVAGQLMDQRYPGRIEVHGFGGDPLTDRPPPAKTPSDWAGAVTAFLAKNDTFALQGLMPDSGRSLLPSTPFVAESALSYDLQLNLGYRQAQRIRPMRVAESRYRFPFEDPRWSGFWLNRSAPELAGQTLFIGLLRYLRSSVYFDLEACRGDTRDEVRRNRLAMLYGTKDAPLPVGDSTKVLPRHRTAHFCLFACYRNNPSFAAMVDQALKRLRSRGVFDPSFIDGVEQRFRNGERGADKQLNGLMTTDIAIEAGRFS
jgi:hypothetical protein